MAALHPLRRTGTICYFMSASATKEPGRRWRTIRLVRAVRAPACYQDSGIAASWAASTSTTTSLRIFRQNFLQHDMSTRFTWRGSSTATAAGGFKLSSIALPEHTLPTSAYPVCARTGLNRSVAARSSVAGSPVPSILHNATPKMSRNSLIAAMSGKQG